MRRETLALVWLWVAACACGAVVMAVEFLGARMLSVGYGSSQTVWAAMISVTLLSLTAGYFIGGFLADRYPRPGLLYAAILAGGALLTACPHARFILKACYNSLGIEGGALASSMVVFFLPLGLLGMTSPFVIKIITERGRKVGMTAGGVYAVSTVGSVAGTLLTAFYLIPQCGAPAGFRITAAAAAAVAAIGLITTLGWRGAAALLVPVILSAVPSPTPRVGNTYAAPGGDVVVKHVRDSHYGHITVLDKGDYRLLVVNGIVQTGIAQNLARIGKAQHLLDNYFQELLPYTVDDPESKSALLIGLAGGLTARLLDRYGMRVDSVDLDPEIIEVAREWFGFNGSAAVADGRRFLEDCKTRYDFCIIDTYSGDGFPFYMASLEAFRAAKGVLNPGGVLAINFIGSPAGRPFACMYRTLSEVFPNVRALRGEDPREAANPDDVQTITIFASDNPITFNKGWMDFLDFEDGQRVSRSIEKLTVVPRRRDGFLLTDAHNPIDLMRSREALRWRERTIEDRIGKDVLF